MIGYRTVAFADRPIETALATIAEAGYNAVELCLEHPDLNPLELTPERITRLNGWLAQNGLAVAAVSYHGVQDQLEDRRLRTYAAIDRLDDLGAKVFVVASRREEPARLRAQWDEAVDLYRELADRCGKHDAVLAVEPQPGLVVRSSEDLVKMIRACDHPRVAANLDIAHASLTSDDLSWSVFQLGERLVHVHVSDAAEGVHRHLVPGHGEVDFDEIREILDSARYRGPLVIDIPRSEEDPADTCRAAYQAFRAQWGLPNGH